MIYLSKAANHCRYGAFELKAKYRRNMLTGTLVSALLAIATTAGAFLFTQPRSEPVIEENNIGCDTFFVDFGKKIEVEPKRPTRVNSPHRQANVDGSKIIMVDDELFEDEDERISSLNALYIVGAYDVDVEGAGNYDNNNGYAYFGEGRPEYPNPDSVVFTDVMAEMIYEFKPEYPWLAKKAGLEGFLWVKALVDIDGSVKDAMIIRSSNSRAGFDEAALKAAYFNKYKPAIRNNRPVAIWVSYKVEFVLENEL